MLFRFGSFVDQTPVFLQEKGSCHAVTEGSKVNSSFAA